MTSILRYVTLRNMPRPRGGDRRYAKSELEAGAEAADIKALVRRERLSRSTTCAHPDCANTKDLSPTGQHTRSLPDLICPPCRFKFFNVPEDCPKAKRHDWRLFDAGYLDESKSLPVRETQKNNRWYHAGRMTAVEVSLRKEREAEERLVFSEAREMAQAKVDEIIDEVRALGGVKAAERVIAAAKEELGAQIQAKKKGGMWGER